MNRFLILLVAVLLVLAGVATLVLGSFPPTPTTHPVEKVLPNDKFQTH